MYKETGGLFELLTRKKLDHSLISTQDVKNYRRILDITNGHRENNGPSGVIKTTRGIKFNEIISRLFPGTKKRGVESALRRQWVSY